MFDVSIIGAGVIGGAIARALSRYNLKVCVLEKENDVAMGTSKANSAIVHAGFDAKENSLKAKFNVKGSLMMKKLCKELDVKYKRNGALVIGFSDEDRSYINELYNRGLKNGVKRLRVLEKAQLLKLEPNLSDNVICALYAPTSAIICPYDLTIALIGNAMDNGVELMRNFLVEKIHKLSDHYTIISKDGESIKSKYVINCAGLYSDRIASLVGDNSFKITPRRGEYLLLDKECGNIVKTTIFRTPTAMGKGILVTPTVDGNLLTGPTSENVILKDDLSTTKQGLEKVIKEAGLMVKGIPFNKTITSFSGLRAVGDTGDFIINVNKHRFINVAGIESPGLSSAPAIAEYVLTLLVKDGLLLKRKKNFKRKRRTLRNFSNLSIRQKNKIIRKNPAYGKIVCRCESISEGEIIEAIKTNPKPTDLDGIKRRTRAQMGRCQGGFCSPYVVKLLSRETGTSVLEITKKGGNSFVVTGRTKEGE